MSKALRYCQPATMAGGSELLGFCACPGRLKLHARPRPARRRAYLPRRTQHRASFVAVARPRKAKTRPASQRAALSAWELDCQASLTTAPQVRWHLRLSVGTRQVPFLTLASGMQRARCRTWPSVGGVTWKARIEGEGFDLDTLGELFPTGDPLVAQDLSGGYYLESVALQDSNGQIDQDAARALIKRINGIGRAINSGYQPVMLTGRYTEPDGSVTIALTTAALTVRPTFKAVGIVTRNGVPVPPPPPGVHVMRSSLSRTRMSQTHFEFWATRPVGLVRHIQGLGDR